jgi:hypothetical protein
MRRDAEFCAWAGNGHAPRAPSIAMNSRRVIFVSHARSSAQHGVSVETHTLSGSQTLLKPSIDGWR